MLETLPAKPSTTITNKAASSSPSPFAFVPRQVALASQRNMKSKKVSSETLENGSEMVDKTLTVESIDKKDKTKKNDKKKKKDNKNTVSPFLLSLAAFLQEQGFTKTLAVFRSEASIPDEFDSSKVLAFNEETYMKCVEARKCDAKSSKNDSKGFDTLNDDTVEDGLEESKGAATVEPSVKKKKKRNNGGDDSIEDTQCVNDSDDKLTKSQVKKKKSKLDVESSNGNSLEIGSETITGATEIAPESQLAETDRKSKDKKKKKSKLISVENGESDLVLVDNTANIDKKSSKKRKRMISEGNESQPGTDGRQKSEVLKDKGMENELLESEGHAGKKRKTVNGDTKTSDETSLDKKLDVLSEEQNAEKVSDSQTKVASHFNSDLEKNGKEGIAPQKSAKKQQNGSAEPKTAKAFQRVKVDEVKFADDRLQDNSYWAKGGADIGYGAKAQEVLGQVRGRDFRHEKTKKKRGSYRGGQIDLQTHSVKFNYSDEE